MFITIDIGGTNARIAFANRTDIPQFFAVEKFPLVHNIQEDHKKIFEIIDTHISGKISGISIGIAGTLSDDKEYLKISRHLPEWENVKFPQLLGEKYNCLVWMSNDVAMAAWSEAFDEIEDGEYLYLAWGTGIGGAKITKKDNMFQVVKLYEYKDVLRSIETKCGGNAIFENYAKKATELNGKEWAQVEHDFEEGIITLSNAVGTKKILLTGGVADKLKDRIEPIIKHLKDKSLTLSFSKFGEDAGIYGGLSLAQYHLNNIV